MIEVADLLSPEGPIEASFFPSDSSDDLNARLAAYITDGSSRVGGLLAADQDDATQAWALWRAFDAIALRLATSFSSATIEGDSRAISGAQAKLMRDRANDQRAIFSAFVLAVGEAAGTATAPAQTGSITLGFSS
jgi:hypothetical protein